MFTLDVKADVQPIIAKLNALKQGLGDRVIVTSLNETIDQTRTKMSRGIRETYNLKASEVAEFLKVDGASRTGQKFVATLYGNKYGRAKRALNVIRFIVTRGEKSRARKAKRLAAAFGGRATYDPRFKILAAGGAKAIEGAFVMRSKTGAEFVLERKGGRLVSVYTVGVPQMFGAKKIQEPVIRWIPGKFNEVFERRMRYFLSTVQR